MRNGITWSKYLAAGSLAMALVFTGNAAASARQTAPPEQTQAAVPTQTLPPPTETQLPTFAPTEPAYLAECAAIAAQADGKQIFVWDGERGQMLYTNGDGLEKLYPASITKLYAAFVALMYLNPEEVITAGEELSRMQPGSSRAYINRGSQLTAQMLVEAMLIPSGNDAAYVLSAAAGRAIAGDAELDANQAVDRFIQEMNEKKAELGLENSNFMNPDGYHHEAHYMCVKDVAAVASLALQQPVIAKFMAMQQDSVTFVSGERIAWYNTNHLINPESPYYHENAVGMKTGYTSAAGQCLVAAFRENGRDIVVGIFGAEESYRRYSDAIKLYEACAKG